MWHSKDIAPDYVLTNCHWQLAKFLSFMIERGQDIGWQKFSEDMTESLTIEETQMNHKSGR